MIIELDSAYVTHEIALDLLEEIYKKIKSALNNYQYCVTPEGEVMLYKRELNEIVQMIEDSNK